MDIGDVWAAGETPGCANERPHANIVKARHRGI
jgi:hypothetical protein